MIAYIVDINRYPVLSGILMQLLSSKEDGIEFDGLRKALREILFLDDAMEEVKTIPKKCMHTERKRELTYGLCSGRVVDGTLLIDSEQLKRVNTIIQSYRFSQWKNCHH